MSNTIVTRHPALVEFLAKRGITGKVISHATPGDVEGKHTYGVLPLSLAVLTISHTEVPLRVPAELRGVELSLEQVEQYAGEPVAYNVELVHEVNGRRFTEGQLSTVKWMVNELGNVVVAVKFVRSIHPSLPLIEARMIAESVRPRGCRCGSGEFVGDCTAESEFCG